MFYIFSYSVSLCLWGGDGNRKLFSLLIEAAILNMFRIALLNRQWKKVATLCMCAVVYHASMQSDDSDSRVEC